MVEEEARARCILDGEDESSFAALGWIRLEVVSLSGETIVMMISPFATIREIKQALDKSKGIPIHEQRLLLDAELLEDARVMADCTFSDCHKFTLVKGNFYTCAAFEPELSLGCVFENNHATLIGAFNSSGNPANYARGPPFPNCGKHKVSIRVDGGCHHGGSNDCYVGVVSVEKGANLGGMDKYNLSGAWLWKMEYSNRSVITANGVDVGEAEKPFPIPGDVITVEMDMDALSISFYLNKRRILTIFDLTDADLQPCALAYYRGTKLTLVPE